MFFLDSAVLLSMSKRLGRLCKAWASPHRLVNCGLRKDVLGEKCKLIFNG